MIVTTLLLVAGCINPSARGVRVEVDDRRTAPMFSEADGYHLYLETGFDDMVEWSVNGVTILDSHAVSDGSLGRVSQYLRVGPDGQVEVRREETGELVRVVSVAPRADPAAPFTFALRISGAPIELPVRAEHPVLRLHRDDGGALVATYARLVPPYL